jgi:glucan phosphoethanolaminetransferase (alkaline phosphatase superfamily)
MLVLVATCGFGFLFADTIIEHFAIFKQEILVYVPIVFSFIGLVIGIITVYNWKKSSLKPMQYFFFISFLVAGWGFYLHIVEESEEELQSIEAQQHEANEKEKPILAPLSFGGIAVIGLLGTSRKWKAEVE